MSLVDRVKTQLKLLIVHYAQYAVYGKGAALVLVLKLVFMLKGSSGFASGMLEDGATPFSKFLRDLSMGKLLSIRTDGPDNLQVTLRGHEKAYRVEIPPVVDRASLWAQVNAREGLFIGTSVGSRITNTVVQVGYAAAPVIYLGMLYYFMQTMLNGGKEDSKSEHKTSSLTLRDVAGIGSDAELALRDVLSALRTPDLYDAVGARRPRGCLLYGPAGCGKTLIARAMAGEAKLPFFVASASDFVEMLVGRGAARVRRLFAQAEECAPSIVFIDEIDALAKARGGLNSNDEREQTLNQLLTELDGFDVKTSHVLVVAATNRPDVLDAALLRAGRFDLHVRIAPPDEAGRRAVLRVHMRKLKLPTALGPDALDELVGTLAAQTGSWTGADLALLANEAAVSAVRCGRGEVMPDDFDAALRKICTSRIERRN